MNPSEQQDLEDVFGPEAAAKVSGFTKRPVGSELSDRYAENLARRRGSALPEMGEGKKPTGSKYIAMPLNPLEGGDDRRGSYELPIDGLSW